jgi:hypothetical protein
MSKLEIKTTKPNIKRRLASRQGCLYDLKAELPLFFDAYKKACEDYNREINQTPPESRCITLEASLLNSKLIFRFQSQFPFNWKYGKYRRFILYKNGYLVLIKKLDHKGKPMNIRTKIVESINYQRMGSLFQDSGYTEEPILYFGYRKDKTGNLFHPQIVYIDEDQISWTIDESALAAIKSISINAPSEQTVSPTVRVRRKKASNE